jgi:hypothetical protein
LNTGIFSSKISHLATPKPAYLFGLVFTQYFDLISKGPVFVFVLLDPHVSYDKDPCDSDSGPAGGQTIQESVCISVPPCRERAPAFARLLRSEIPPFLQNE